MSRTNIIARRRWISPLPSRSPDQRIRLSPSSRPTSSARAPDLISPSRVRPRLRRRRPATPGRRGFRVARPSGSAHARAWFPSRARRSAVVPVRHSGLRRRQKGAQGLKAVAPRPARDCRTTNEQHRGASSSGLERPRRVRHARAATSPSPRHEMLSQHGSPSSQPSEKGMFEALKQPRPRRQPVDRPRRGQAGAARPDARPPDRCSTLQPQIKPECARLHTEPRRGFQQSKQSTRPPMQAQFGASKHQHVGRYRIEVRSGHQRDHRRSLLTTAAGKFGSRPARAGSSVASPAASYQQHLVHPLVEHRSEDSDPAPILRQTTAGNPETARKIFSQLQPPPVHAAAPLLVSTSFRVHHSASKSDQSFFAGRSR